MALGPPPVPAETGKHDDVIQPAARPPIRRGPRARDRVLVAALEVLAERGLAGFNMEAVAHRAGASKPTLYRRWRSPGELLIDAMDASFRPLPLPATSDLRSGLVELLTTFERLLDSQPYPRLLAAFMDAAERDPQLKSLHAELTERRREPLRLLLIKARERGELPATANIELAVDLLGGSPFYRHFVAHRGCPDDYVTALVDHVLRSLDYGKPAAARRKSVGAPGGARVQVRSAGIHSRVGRSRPAAGDDASPVTRAL